MMRTALREPTLVEQVERWAHETSQPVEKVLEAAVQVYLGNAEREGAGNRLAVLRSLPPLRAAAGDCTSNS